MSTGGAVERTEELSHEDPCEGRVLKVQRLLPHDLTLFLDTGGKEEEEEQLASYLTTQGNRKRERDGCGEMRGI